jgi:hypothetical protein
LQYIPKGSCQITLNWPFFDKHHIFKDESLGSNISCCGKISQRFLFSVVEGLKLAEDNWAILYTDKMQDIK